MANIKKKLHSKTTQDVLMFLESSSHRRNILCMNLSTAAYIHLPAVCMLNVNCLMISK